MKVADGARDLCGVEPGSRLRKAAFSLQMKEQLQRREEQEEVAHTHFYRPFSRHCLSLYNCRRADAVSLQEVLFVLLQKSHIMLLKTYFSPKDISDNKVIPP